jgi:hypothetical protein
MGFTDKTEQGKEIAAWLISKGAKFVKKPTNDTILIYKLTKIVKEKLEDIDKTKVKLIPLNEFLYAYYKKEVVSTTAIEPVKALTTMTNTQQSSSLKTLPVTAVKAKDGISIDKPIHSDVKVSTAVKNKIKNFVKAWREQKDDVFVDEHHKKFCETTVKKYAKLQKPYVSYSISIDLPIMRMNRIPLFIPKYLTSYKQPFNLIHVRSSVYLFNNYSLRNILYKHMTNKKDIMYFENLVNSDWLKEMNNYVSNLSTKYLYTMVGYTYYGDVVANNYMRNTLSETKFMEDLKNVAIWTTYHPLFYQAIDLIRKTDDISSILSKPDASSVTKVMTLLKNVNLPINEVYVNLRKNATLFSYDKFWKSVIQAFIDDLNRIIMNAPPIKTTMVVYRGSKDSYYLKGNVGHVYKTDSFVSTSLDLQSALNFSKGTCCFKRITLLPGTRVLMLAGISHFQNEIEFLLSTKSQFYLTNEKRYISRDTTNLCPNKKTDILVTDAVVIK